MESWLESPAATWKSVAICCRLTNRTHSPHKVTYALSPPFHVSVFDRVGTRLKTSRDAGRYFSGLDRGQFYFSAYITDLAPGKSLEARIPLTKAFIGPELGNGQIKITWNPDTWEPVPGLVNELHLPDKPTIIAPPDEVRRDTSPVDLEHQDGGRPDTDITPEYGQSMPKSDIPPGMPYLPNVTVDRTIPWLAWAVVLLSALGLLWLNIKKRR